MKTNNKNELFKQMILEYLLDNIIENKDEL
jgi:hypothetical protein